MPGGISPRTSRARRRRRRKQFLMRVRTFLFRASSCGRERPPFPQELPPHPLREQILLRPPERTSFRNVCKKYTLPAFINCKRFVKKKLNPAFFCTFIRFIREHRIRLGNILSAFHKRFTHFPYSCGIITEATRGGSLTKNNKKCNFFEFFPQTSATNARERRFSAGKYAKTGSFSFIMRAREASEGTERDIYFFPIFIFIRILFARIVFICYNAHNTV